MGGDKRREPGDMPAYEQFRCRACELRDGVATVAGIEIVTPVLLSRKTGKLNRKLSTRRLVCARCWASGFITYIV